MKRIEGKVAIVTGASSGIGRAIAKVFAQEGAKVVMASTTESKGLKVLKEIEEAGGEGIFIQTDMAKNADIERLVNKTMEKYGRIDILVNNAGIPDDFDENMDEEKLHRLMDVNFNGPFLLSRMILPIMKEQGGGNIVNISSTGGLHSTGKRSTYSASKAALQMMTRNMARINGKYNIRVNCVAPAQIETPIWWLKLGREPTPEEVARERIARAAPAPLGRVGQPEEIAYPVLFLVSDEGSFINGAILPVDGGEAA